MIKVRDEKDQANIAKVYRAGQDHVFRFWEELPPDDRRVLLDQLDRIDYQLLARLSQRLDEKPGLHQLEPPPEVTTLADVKASEADWRARGEDLLARGAVAVLLVAGGQGTRLGFQGPKGAFPIGPVSDKSLFQLFAEKIAALDRRYRKCPPWYVMTSEGNYDETVEFFKSHQYFGLGRADVQFFRQREIPALDQAGKVLLAEKGRIATSPNGHGGVVPALVESGSLEDMARRGVEMIFYWQVDNPLVKVADPVFLGAMLAKDAEAAAKVASKRGPGEKVGVWGLVDGKLGVIEYSELPKEDAEKRTSEGKLVYDAGNLAIHAFRRSFLERISKDGTALPWHRAIKKVPHVSRRGEHVEPEAPNGLKFEMFVFDAIAAASKTLIYETDRQEEFAPVKNATGEDSPESSRKALTRLYAGWLEKAGAKVERDASGDPPFPIEISPLTALEPADLADKIEPGLEVKEALKL